MNADYIVETNHQVSDFSGTAVNQLSIHIRKNEIYGFQDQQLVKSTAKENALGLLQPTHGSIKLFYKTFNSNQISLLSKCRSL